MSSRRSPEHSRSYRRDCQDRRTSFHHGPYEAGEIRESLRRRSRHRSGSPVHKRDVKEINPAAEKMQDPAFRSMILDALKERNLISQTDDKEQSCDERATPSEASPQRIKRPADEALLSASPASKKRHSHASPKKPEEDMDRLVSTENKARESSQERGVANKMEKELEEEEAEEYVEAALTLQTPSPDETDAMKKEELGSKGLHEARMMDRYEFLGSISQGTYGVVYKGRCHSSGAIKAFKRVKKQNKNNTPEAFPLTSLREIQILSSLSHPNIVGLQEVCLTDSRGILKVMDYAEFDLKRILEIKKESFASSEIKCIMKQILNALDFLHEHWIMHRDLKPSNILYDNKGNVKLCDFGLARHYGDPLRKYTPLVVTLYYRAPELLLGMEKYSPAIDMWSLGCIMAEIILGKVLFQETSELALISSILNTVGEPADEEWSEFKTLPNTKNIKLNGDSRNKLPDMFSSGYAVAGPELLTSEGVKFLCELLEINPEKRLTARQALDHEYFREFPPPCHKRLLPTFVDLKKQNFNQ